MKIIIKQKINKTPIINREALFHPNKREGCITASAGTGSHTWQHCEALDAGPVEIPLKKTKAQTTM